MAGATKQSRKNTSAASQKRIAEVSIGQDGPNSSKQYVRKKRKSARKSHPRKQEQSAGIDPTISQEERPEYLKKIGAPRELQVPRSKAGGAPHPSKGGSTGYPVEMRKMLVDLYQEGKEVDKSMRRSIQRWIKNGVEPLKQSGNKCKTAITGEHLFLLAFFKLIWPQATREECSAFIAIHSSDGRVLTNTEVTKGYKHLDLTLKKGSTTAYQAFTPKNTYLHFCFWNFDFPGGIKDVPMERLMDGDEMAFHLGDASKSYGHAVKGLRMRKAGNYSRGQAKVVVVMFIEPGDPALAPHIKGSKENPRIWYRVSTDSGTTVENYQEFLENDVFPKFRKDEPQRTLMHDNLSSHKAGEIYDTVYERGHRVLCRPPYRPYEAPIEWVFNQLACAIRRKWSEINNETDLIDMIRNIIERRDGIGGFYELFQLCGYGPQEEGVSEEVRGE